MQIRPTPRRACTRKAKGRARENECVLLFFMRSPTEKLVCKFCAAVYMLLCKYLMACVWAYCSICRKIFQWAGSEACHQMGPRLSVSMHWEIQNDLKFYSNCIRKWNFCKILCVHTNTHLKLFYFAGLKSCSKHFSHCSYFLLAFLGLQFGN